MEQEEKEEHRARGDPVELEKAAEGAARLNLSPNAAHGGPRLGALMCDYYSDRSV